MPGSAKRGAFDGPPEEPSAPGGRTYQVSPPAADGNRAAPVLDVAFDSGTLSELRAEVKAHACKAGLPERRATDVVLAVHELAANAVHHGAGAGRLRVWKLAGALHCQVEDGGPPAPGQPPMQPLPIEPGHGLWVAQYVADQIQVLSGACGTCATVTFNVFGPGTEMS